MKALCDLSVTGQSGFELAGEGFSPTNGAMGKGLCCRGLATKFPRLNVLTW
jgi:hypothetical protein